MNVSVITVSIVPNFGLFNVITKYNNGDEFVNTKLTLIVYDQNIKIKDPIPQRVRDNTPMLGINITFTGNDIFKGRFASVTLNEDSFESYTYNESYIQLGGDQTFTFGTPYIFKFTDIVDAKHNSVYTITPVQIPTIKSGNNRLYYYNRPIIITFESPIQKQDFIFRSKENENIKFTILDDAEENNITKLIIYQVKTF